MKSDKIYEAEKEQIYEIGQTWFLKQLDFFVFFVAVAIQSWKAIESLIVTFVTTRTGETFILSAGLPHILPGFTFFGLKFILKK